MDRSGFTPASNLQRRMTKGTSPYGIPHLINIWVGKPKGYNSGMTCAVTSNHITIILQPKSGDYTLSDFKFLGYIKLDTPTFQTPDNSNT
ncbi:hypothetical protein TNCV_2119651 [Trichonephila clavipes]|nr:hypothetical protein TNCV_2119651 [Trichonephila clavipes]